MLVYSDNALITLKRGKNKELRFRPQASNVTDFLPHVITEHSYWDKWNLFYTFFVSLCLTNDLIPASHFNRNTPLDQSKCEFNTVKCAITGIAACHIL